MKEQKGLTWPQVRYWMATLGLIALGFVATIWGGPWGASKPIANELGPGIFTAGILAALVEPFFRREFARDAFLSAFRYVLPQEFREEVEKIIRFDFIADKQIWIVKVEKHTDDVVKVTTSYERTVRNKTKSNKGLKAWYEVEDYAFTTGPTEIVSCCVELGSTKLDGGPQILKPHYVERRTAEIAVPPDKMAKVWGKAIQYRRTNDDIFETFRDPIVNPEIEVIIDDTDFCHRITFGTHGDVTKSKFKNHYTLSGVYFPGQFMVVRWWPRQRMSNPVTSEHS